MKLHISFDDELLRRYARRGSSPFFTIYWASADGFYPEEGWMDFGSVVLSWWLKAARQLLEGEPEGELVFMDGPFRLKMRSIGNTISVSAADLDQPWQVTQEMFVHELLAGAKRIQRKLHELGLGTADQEGLQAGVVQLEVAIANQQKRKGTGMAQKQYAA